VPDETERSITDRAALWRIMSLIFEAVEHFLSPLVFAWVSSFSVVALRPRAKAKVDHDAITMIALELSAKALTLGSGDRPI
jgi:hypothetical protein